MTTTQPGVTPAGIGSPLSVEDRRRSLATGSWTGGLTNTGPALDQGWMSARYGSQRRREIMSKTTVALAGIVILSAAILAA